MSDLRARIADALREHHENLGTKIGVVDNYWLHLADGVLSLPGIAVVQLPNLNIWPLAEISFGNNKSPMSPELARTIAAGLLASADAAEATA